MDLGGRWRLAEATEARRRQLSDPDLDDSGWVDAPVPGHWRDVPGFESSDGPVLYRHRFSADPLPAGRRTFLVFEGIFYQADVWLDKEYLGDTEGYFFPHDFEVTGPLGGGGEHVIGVEVNCDRPSDLKAKRNLTGVFQHWDSIAPGWNPGGIWGGVRLVDTGPVRLSSLQILCPEANAERAVLDLEAELDSAEPGPVQLTTTIASEGDDPADSAPAVTRHEDHVLSAGPNTVRWRVAVERPSLWWPRSLGGQPLYRVTVEVATGGDSGPVSDRAVRLTGLRQVRMRDFVTTVNGERLFLKGANYGPTRRDPANTAPGQVVADVEAAAAAGLDLLRVHAHVGRPELYEAADRAGVLLWQDLPLQWGYANVRRQARVQARQAARMLGHHPSILVWCGHNEPVPADGADQASVGQRTRARLAAAQLLPTWNKTALDRSVRRSLERSDPSRPVVAHSGVVPHPAWGTDSHLWFGWYRGSDRDLAVALSRLPVIGRFVSEFGAQAVPDTNAFMQPDRWPHLDWDRLEADFCLQLEPFAERVPSSAFPTFDAWRAASQEYQADLLRHQIETLRRLKYRPTGGFCFFMLSDAQPAVSCSVLDHERRPKLGYQAVKVACQPVIVTCDRPEAAYRPGQKIALDVHVVSDLRTPIEGGVVEARMSWPGGERTWRFVGQVDADRCVRVGRLELALPRWAEGPLTVDLVLDWPGGRVVNRYASWVGEGQEKGIRPAGAKTIYK